MNEDTYRTEQERFWAGQFGTDYIQRNESESLLASNLVFFSKALHQASRIHSCVEFGANIGMNLKALKLLYPDLQPFGIEINKNAASQLENTVGKDRVFNGSILDYSSNNTFDLCLVKGVLIHINPDLLPTVYDILVKHCGRYLLVAEYYNPTPIQISYRGHAERLFKRDFAGEILDRHLSLKLIDYGFSYKRDPSFPQDDITWFLMEKKI
jgi:pseudaminic acid biosynthesis-associated methylase